MPPSERRFWSDQLFNTLADKVLCFLKPFQRSYPRRNSRRREGQKEQGGHRRDTCSVASDSIGLCLFTPLPARGRFSLIHVPLQSGKTKSDQEPQLNQVEINNIGKLFDRIRKQPTNPHQFTFMGESYQARREKCISQEPHIRGAVCFSGLKYNPDVSRPLMSAELSVFPDSQYSLAPQPPFPPAHSLFVCLRNGLQLFVASEHWQQPHAKRFSMSFADSTKFSS